MNRNKLDLAFKDYGIEAVISNAPQTILWFTGIPVSEGWIVIEPSITTLFVDGRYYEFATKNAKHSQTNVELLTKNSFENFLKDKKFKKIAIESDYLHVTHRSKIKKITGLDSKNILSLRGKDLRILKTKDEIDKIQIAINISLEAYQYILKYLKVGVSEREIDHKLNYLMKRLGADKEAFDNIIAFGANTAEPHHHPNETKLKDGDIVKIDFGACFEGYKADITRTFIFGDEGKANSQLKQILEIVEEAARLGREAVKPGIKSSEVDKVCRDYIEQKGYGSFFIHSTGHGIGLDVHELPVVSSTSETILEEGMIITVEPGIYIEGLGGARIEDDVLVTKNGNKVLSRRK